MWFGLFSAAVVATKLPTLSTWRPLEPVPPNLDALNSTAGAKLLSAADTDRTAFIQLAQHFETQTTQTWCGIASAVAMFNALHVAAPIDPSYAPYPYFTQNAYFNDCVVRLIGHDTNGITLDEWASTVACWGGHATVFHAGNSSIQNFTEIASKAMLNGHQVVINFFRTELGEMGGGHFSPLAAYSPSSQKFLLMDVARYKYPPVWASPTDIFAAMNTIDTSSNLTRGFAVLAAN